MWLGLNNRRRVLKLGCYYYCLYYDIIAYLIPKATLQFLVDFLKVRFCGSPVGLKTDFPQLQRAIFYRPDFRSAMCPGVWQQ